LLEACRDLAAQVGLPCADRAIQTKCEISKNPTKEPVVVIDLDALDVASVGPLGNPAAWDLLISAAADEDPANTCDRLEELLDDAYVEEKWIPFLDLLSTDDDEEGFAAIEAHEESRLALRAAKARHCKTPAVVSPRPLVPAAAPARTISVKDTPESRLMLVIGQLKDAGAFRKAPTLEELLDDPLEDAGGLDFTFEGTDEEIDMQVVGVARDEEEERLEAEAIGSDDSSDDVEVVEPLPKMSEILSAIRVLEHARPLESNVARALELDAVLRQFKRVARVEESTRVQQTRLADFFQPKVRTQSGRQAD
jgi:hypothetical protein